MFSCDTYFYEQKKRKRFHNRRLRIIDDSYSLFGDRATVTFRGRQDTDLESTVGFASRPNLARRPSTGILRPGSSRGRHVAIAPTASTLPPLDPSGPKLVSTEVQDSDTKEIHHTEKKLEFLEEVEEKQKPKHLGRKNDWNLSEAKFASSSILSNLSKFLEKVSESLEISLPVDLVDELIRRHEHLIENTPIVKRQWQTDCYQDFEVKNKRPFLTSVPESQVRENADRFVGKLVTKQRNEREKHVQLKQKPTTKKRMASPERPMTARSVMSNYSMKSDVSQPSDDGRESRYDYDLLPAELRPSILHYRRESSTPKLKTVRTTSTRLEKLKKMRRLDIMTPKKKTKFVSEDNLTTEKLGDSKKTDGENTEPAGSKEKPVTETIPFHMNSEQANDEGWIVTPGDSHDPEANTLRLWEKQLKELMRHREDEKILAKQRGEDGPLLVKFYNNPQMRMLRTKGHQRSATFPMPAVFSKLPPSIASFTTPSPNEALLIGEGLTVFVLTLPDGSGYCNYHSGRVAVSVSRHNGVGKGVYTLLYEDCEGSPLIAYFTPNGSGCCYHHNSGTRMLYSRDGGSLFDEDGYVTRKWSWPAYGLNLAVSVNIQINANLSLRCTSLTSMMLRFSCRGQSHKFSLTPADHGNINGEKIDLSQGELLTNSFFSSKYALSHLPAAALPIVDSRKETKKKESKWEKLKLRVSSGKVSQSEDEENLIMSNVMLQKARPEAGVELANYKDRIKTVVDNWMHHYRESIGIALPNRLLSSSRRRTPPDIGSLSSRDLSLPQSGGRLVKSSMGYYPGEGYSRPSSRQGKHTRSYTHPVPSPSTSRAPSPLLQLGLPMMRAARTSPGLGAERSRSISPPYISKPASPPDNVRSNQSPGQLKPFKTGTSKPKTKPLKIASGCPVGLHNMLLKDMESMPACKCDKRHIPYISDLEYDIFLLSHVPKTQLVIICIVSSVVENSRACEPMLNAIHCVLNRNRFSPCTQCSGDPYRLLRYDTCRALKGLRSTKPLLVERHNVTPGMFLMYMGGRLVHADRMFNGYGITKRDFMKQVQTCINDGKMGKSLPYDFKLTHRNGSKTQSQNTWAYPVSGVMQDLIPFTPESDSGTTSRHSVLEGSKLEESFAEMSYGGDYLQLSMYDSQFNSRSQSRVSVLEMSQAGSIVSVGEH